MSAKNKTQLDESVSEKIEITFSKKRLLSAERFRNKRDVLNAVLENYSDNDRFTVKDVDRMVDEYMKGKVK